MRIGGAAMTGVNIEDQSGKSRSSGFTDQELWR
jgi:hypothetical protein